MEPVLIRRCGNLLEVSPPTTAVLEPALSYTHRKMNYDPFGANKKSMTIEDRPLFRVTDGKLYTTQGALKLMTDALTAANVPYKFEDMRPVTVLEPDYEYLKMCMPNLEFRYKQDEILATLIALNSGVIVAPTAYGKTFIILALAALYPKANIIIASPSTALLRGTYRRMLEISPDVGRVGGGKKDPRRITLSTFNSILRAPVDKCDILLIDECVSGDSVIITEKGRIRIRDVRKRGCNYVLTSGGARSSMFKKITGFYSRGHRPVVKVRTTRGKLICTHEHEVKTTRGWCRADELRRGDKIISTGINDILLHVLGRLRVPVAVCGKLVLALRLRLQCAVNA